MGRFHRGRIIAVAAASWLTWATTATAFLNNGQWSFTATDGPTPPLGNAVTLTWSIVPDDTAISFYSSRPSNLVSFLDGLFGGGPGGTDFTLRPWFPWVKQCFDRWSALSGLEFVYEPADDGLSGHPQGAWAGLLGSRGDVRLGGLNIDGTSGTLGSTGFIPDADITLDTGDSTYFGAPGTNANYTNLRTTLTHEIGHSLGLGHSSSTNAAFLMEGFSQTSFDGPQLDDIRGIQYIYGDFNEKSNGGTGNGTIATATPLGTIAAGESVLIGEHAATGTVVLPAETDFVSISNSSDTDYFSFTTLGPALVDIAVTPVGSTYNERGTVVSAAVSDLSLEVYSLVDEVPVLLASASLNPIGQPESLVDLRLDTPGTYYARVTGSTANIQLYQLAVAIDSLLLGDFNDDGLVDAADYSFWRDHFGMADDGPLLNRGDGLAGIDQGDYDVWKAHFGDSAGMGSLATTPVPEPTTAPMWLLAIGLGGRFCHRLWG